jgi:hypothetical protein
VAKVLRKPMGGAAVVSIQAPPDEKNHHIRQGLLEQWLINPIHFCEYRRSISVTVRVHSGYSQGTVRVQSGLQSGLVKAGISVFVELKIFKSY